MLDKWRVDITYLQVGLCLDLWVPLPIRGARFYMVLPHVLWRWRSSRESLTKRRDVGEVGTVVEKVNVESI